MKFNDKAVKEVMDDLENLKIDDIIITGEQINEVKRILNLDNQNKDQLIATRNSVVKLFDDKMESLENHYSRQIMNTISGVVAVIDREIYSFRANI